LKYHNNTGRRENEPENLKKRPRLRHRVTIIGGVKEMIDRRRGPGTGAIADIQAV
jgi:hypothetical protein